MNRPMYSPAYKWDLCGVVYQLPKFSTTDEAEAQTFLVEHTTHVPLDSVTWIFCAHFCKDGSIGVGRLIGMSKREDGSLPDEKVKAAAMEYARRKRMEDAFDSYLEASR